MLKEHTDRFYRPENIVVSIAGKFDEKAALDQLTRTLGPIKGGKPKMAVTKPQITPCNIVKDKDIEQAHVAIASEGISVGDDRRYQLAVLDLGLGGNMSSRLFQEVREKRGLVYTINSYKTSHANCGLFGVYAGTAPNKVKQVVELVMEEFRRVKAEGLTPQEINRAKAQLKSDLLLGLESMRNRTSRNAYGELFFGRQLDVDEICRDIEKVTEAEVKKLAGELLDSKRMSMVVVGPKKELKGQYVLSC
jgi:predicted Zn-dependent peptidase